MRRPTCSAADRASSIQQKPFDGEPRASCRSVHRHLVPRRSRAVLRGRRPAAVSSITCSRIASRRFRLRPHHQRSKRMRPVLELAMAASRSRHARAHRRARPGTGKEARRPLASCRTADAPGGLSCAELCSAPARPRRERAVRSPARRLFRRPRRPSRALRRRARRHALPRRGRRAGPGRPGQAAARAAGRRGAAGRRARRAARSTSASSPRPTVPCGDARRRHAAGPVLPALGAGNRDPAAPRAPRRPPVAHRPLPRGIRERGMQRVEGSSPPRWSCLRAYSFPGNIRELENVLEATSLALPAGQNANPDRGRAGVAARAGRARRTRVPTRPSPGAHQSRATRGMGDRRGDATIPRQQERGRAPARDLPRHPLSKAPRSRHARFSDMSL